jgi:hypothetical protein
VIKTSYRAKKVDANQKGVVAELRKRGFSVGITSSLGKGFPDLIIAKGKTVLVELKDGSKSPSQRKLTPSEKKFIDSWRGEIIVANSIDDILLIYETKQKKSQ